MPLYFNDTEAIVSVAKTAIAYKVENNSRRIPVPQLGHRMIASPLKICVRDSPFCRLYNDRDIFSKEM